MKQYNEHLAKHSSGEAAKQSVLKFRDAFFKSGIKSIDRFMSENPKLAPVGKHIIAFEILRAEKDSCFTEEAKWQQEHYKRAGSSEDRSAREYCEGRAGFIGGDWYSYIYNWFLEEAGRPGLPDFTNGEFAFITFNYDRSLEHFFYESLRNSFTEVPEDHITQSISHLNILHVYGQVAPLKWQDTQAGVDYKPQEIDEPLLQKAAANIRTIYEQEEKASGELRKARKLLALSR